MLSRFFVGTTVLIALYAFGGIAPAESASLELSTGNLIALPDSPCPPFPCLPQPPDGELA